MIRVIGISLCSLLIACGGTQGPGGVSEQQANRDALAELRARGEAERAAEAQAGEGSQPASAAPEVPVLPTVVLGPDRGPSVLTEAGALRRSGVEAFHAGGPHMVLGAVTMMPASVEGRVIGFRLDAIDTQTGAWLLAAGVRQGDIVTNVNGRSILMPDVFMAIWDALPAADEIRVDLLRDGSALELRWPVVDE